MTDSKDLPFHTALKTDLEPFEWMKRNDTQMKAMGHAMALDAASSWVCSYAVEREVGAFKPSDESALLVDIGGGFGQHAVAFKTAFPQLQGRVVVQDVASTVAHALAVQGIEFIEHDFFTPQPIRAAKFCYFRHVMHDWADEECVRILENVIPSMGPESRILIDEVVLPEVKVPWQVAIMNLTVMSCLGGIERSREEWVALLDRAGLKMVDLHTYDDVRFHSIVAAVPK
ncbi:hypothetical protein J1614_006158 [Plenodomus biglobosus]|nr:hypothetical protein J1614_006158 [Plenodomus biglobosus]